MTAQRIVVLMSGGAAYGPVQVHALEQIAALHANDAIEWYGVSVGAQHALLGAQGRIHVARDRWNEVDGLDWFMKPNFQDVAKWAVSVGRAPFGGLYSLKGLYRRILGELQHPIVSPCWVGVTDYEDGPRYRNVSLLELWQAPGVTTTTRNDRIASAMCASAAQPVIMEGWPVDGHLCFDGGVKHVVPTFPRVRAGQHAAHVYAVLCSPPLLFERQESKPRSKVNGIVEIAMRSAETWTDAVIVDDMERLHACKSPDTKVTLIAPVEPCGESFDASRKSIQWRLNEVGPKLWADRVEL